MSSSLGLPPYVLTFLRHMDSYKDFLKWNIGESSHKVTLTLSWNFQREKDGPSLREHILEKLHRTLSIAQAGQSDSHVPPDVTTLIQTVPKKHRRTRLKQRITTTLGAIRNSLSLSQDSLDRTDSFMYPRMLNHSNHVPKIPKPPLMRNNSFHGYVTHSTPRAMSLPYSPTRSTECSWPGASSEAETCYSADELDYMGSGDLLCFPASFVYAAPRSPSQSRAILAYRSTPDIDQSVPEDFLDNTSSNMQRRPPPVKQEKDRTVLDWSKIVTGRCPRPSYFKRSLSNNVSTKNPIPPPIVSTNSLPMTVVSTNSFPLPLMSTNSLPPQDNRQAQINDQQTTRGTVIKCLDSCDKILNRYETEIT